MTAWHDRQWFWLSSQHLIGRHSGAIHPWQIGHSLRNLDEDTPHNWHFLGFNVGQTWMPLPFLPSIQKPPQGIMILLCGVRGPNSLASHLIPVIWVCKCCWTLKSNEELLTHWRTWHNTSVLYLFLFSFFISWKIKGFNPNYYIISVENWMITSLKPRGV